MEKLVYLIWDRPSADRAELGRRYRDEISPALLQAGVAGLELHLDDEDATIDGPAPAPGSELPYRAVVSLWLGSHDRRQPVDAILGGLGVRSAGYLVTESTCAEYGDTGNGTARDWVDGERSPGISTVAVVRRNPSLDPRTFRELWYGHQGPMSGEVQPRLRYVRNSVVHPVTSGAPPYDGIVVECWPSTEVVADPIAFHGGPEVGHENLRVMLDSVTQVFDLTPLRSLALSEYIVRSLGG